LCVLSSYWPLIMLIIVVCLLLLLLLFIFHYWVGSVFAVPGSYIICLLCMLGLSQHNGGNLIKIVYWAVHCLLFKHYLIIDLLIAVTCLLGQRYCITIICHLIGRDEIWNKPNILSKSPINHFAKTNLRFAYDQEWDTHVPAKQRKLRTYCLFK